jgi:hypothetical protein
VSKTLLIVEDTDLDRELLVQIFDNLVLVAIGARLVDRR